MSMPMCLGQPPLPPKKFSKSALLNGFLRSSSSSSSSASTCSSSSSSGSSYKSNGSVYPKLMRRYSLRKKRPDRFSCTYQSFSKDLYDDGGGTGNGADTQLRLQSKSTNDEYNLSDKSKFAGKFPYSDFSESTASLSHTSRTGSLNSVFTLSRSHSAGDLSCMSASEPATTTTTDGVLREADSEFESSVNDGDFTMLANVMTPESETNNASFTKYFRALSGSWKNLLNRK